MIFFVATAAVTAVWAAWQSTPAKAATTYYGRSAYNGYFSDRANSGSGDFVLPGGTVSNPSIPYSVNSVGELENFIGRELDTGDNWKQTGASFIVEAMRGPNACSGNWCRNPNLTSSSGAFIDWKDRITGLLNSGGSVTFQGSGQTYSDPDCI